MPRIESFDEETLIAHTLSATTGLCLTMEKDNKGEQRLFLEGCDRPKVERNRVRLTKWGDLRIYDRLCLDWGYSTIRFGGCHNQGGNQAVRFNVQTGAILNKPGQMCLGMYSDSPKYFEKGPCDPEKVPDDPYRTFVVTKFTFKTVFHQDLLASMN